MASSETIITTNDVQLPSQVTLSDINEIQEKLKNLSKTTDKLLQNINKAALRSRARRMSAGGQRYNGTKKSKEGTASPGGNPRYYGGGHENEYREKPKSSENFETCFDTGVEASTCICEYSPRETVNQQNPYPARKSSGQNAGRQMHSGGQSDSSCSQKNSHSNGSLYYDYLNHNKGSILRECEQCCVDFEDKGDSRYCAGESEVESKEPALWHSIRNRNIYSPHSPKMEPISCKTLSESAEKTSDFQDNEKQAILRCSASVCEHFQEYYRSSMPEHKQDSLVHENLRYIGGESEFDREINNRLSKQTENSENFSEISAGLDLERDITKYPRDSKHSAKKTKKRQKHRHNRSYSGGGHLQRSGKEKQTPPSNWYSIQNENEIGNANRSPNSRNKIDKFYDASVKDKRTMSGASNVVGGGQEKHMADQFCEAHPQVEAFPNSNRNRTPKIRRSFKGNNQRGLGHATQLKVVSSTIIQQVRTAKLIKDSKGITLHEVNVRNAKSVQSFLVNPRLSSSDEDLSRYSAGSLNPVLGAKPSLRKLAKLKGRKPLYIKTGIPRQRADYETCQATRTAQTPRTCQCGVPLKTECGKKYEYKHDCRCRIQPTLFKPANEYPISCKELNLKPYLSSSGRPDRFRDSYSVASVASKCEPIMQIKDLVSDPSTVTLSCYNSDREVAREISSCYCRACLLNDKGSDTAKNEGSKISKKPKVCAEKACCSGRKLKPRIISAISCSPYKPEFAQSGGSFGEKICVCPLCGLEHIHNYWGGEESSTASYQGKICQNKTCVANFASKVSAKSSHKIIFKRNIPSDISVETCNCDHSKQVTTKSIKKLTISPSRKSSVHSKQRRLLAPPSTKDIASNIFISVGVSKKPSSRSLTCRCDHFRATILHGYTPQLFKRCTKCSQVTSAEESLPKRTKCVTKAASRQKPPKTQYDSNEINELCQCQTPTYSLSFKSSQNSQSVQEKSSVPTIHSSTSAFAEKAKTIIPSKNVCCSFCSNRYTVNTTSLAGQNCMCVRTSTGTLKSNRKATSEKAPVFSQKENFTLSKQRGSTTTSLRESRRQEAADLISNEKCEKTCYKSSRGCTCDPEKMPTHEVSAMKPALNTSDCLCVDCKCITRFLKQHTSCACRGEKPARLGPDVCLCSQEVSASDPTKESFVCDICKHNFTPASIKKGPHSLQCVCADCLCPDEFDEYNRLYTSKGELCRPPSVEKCPCPDCSKYRAVTGGYHVSDVQTKPSIQLQPSQSGSRSTSKCEPESSRLQSRAATISRRSQSSPGRKYRSSGRSTRSQKPSGTYSRQSSRSSHSKRSNKSRESSQSKEPGDASRSRWSKPTPAGSSKYSKDSATLAPSRYSKSPSKRSSTSTSTLLSEAELFALPQPPTATSSKKVGSFQESESCKCAPICKCISESDTKVSEKTAKMSLKEEKGAEKVSAASYLEYEKQSQVEAPDNFVETHRESKKLRVVESETVEKEMVELEKDDAPKSESEIPKQVDEVNLLESEKGSSTAVKMVQQSEKIEGQEREMEKYFEIPEDQAVSVQERDEQSDIKKDSLLEAATEEQLTECKEKKDDSPQSACSCSLHDKSSKNKRKPCTCSKCFRTVESQQVSLTSYACGCSTQSESFKDVSDFTSSFLSSTESSQEVIVPVVEKTSKPPPAPQSIHSITDQSKTSSHKTTEGDFEKVYSTSKHGASETMTDRAELQRSIQNGGCQSKASSRKSIKESYEEVCSTSNYDAISDHKVSQELAPAGKSCSKEIKGAVSNSRKGLGSSDAFSNPQLSEKIHSEDSTKKSVGDTYEPATAEDSCKDEELIKITTNEIYSSGDVSIEEISKEVSSESRSSFLSRKGGLIVEGRQVKDQLKSFSESSCISGSGSCHISTLLTITNIDGGSETLQKLEEVKADVETIVEKDKAMKADVKKEDSVSGYAKVEEYRKSLSGVITGVCPNDCGCPDCPFLTTEPCKDDPNLGLHWPQKPETSSKKKHLPPLPDFLMKNGSDIACSEALDQIRSIICGVKNKSRRGNIRYTCAMPNACKPEYPSSTNIPLRKCVCGSCSAIQRDNNGGFGLANLLPSICAAKGDDLIKSVSKVDEGSIKNVENCDCGGNNELMSIDYGLNSFLGFLFTEIKNIKDLLNCGLQKIGVKESPQDCLGPPPPYLECKPLTPANLLPPGCCPPSPCCASAVSITGVHSVGSKSLLITWRVNCSVGIIGFEVYVDGCLKSRSFKPSRTSAIAYGVDLNCQHTVTVVALMDQISELQNYSPAVGSFCYKPAILRGRGVCGCYV